MRLGNARERFGRAKDWVKYNSDIIVPIAATLAADIFVRSTGYQPFNNFDKVEHFLAGYGASRFGRKIARRFDKEKYEDPASVAVNVGTSVGYEIYESYKPLASIGDRILEAVFHKASSPSVFDPYDVLANFSGSLIDIASEHVYRRFFKGKK